MITLRERVGDVCGIAGVMGATLTPGELRHTLDLMSGALRHRGPDADGVVIDEALGAGMCVRRLSLVGVHDGHQPIANEDGTIVAAVNGEIYNHRALRQNLQQRGHRMRTGSDIEVVVHLYEEMGTRCFDALNGMFAVALLDRAAGRLVLARDGPGMKQLCYARAAGGLAFASEAKALFASGLVVASPDPDAIDTFLGVGFVPAPRSCFAGIHKLPAGTCLVVERDGSSAQHAFWRLRYTESDPAVTEVEHARRLEHALDASVRSHLDAEVTVGAYLSGGWDSSIVAAMAARATPRPLSTFCVVLPDDPGVDEGRFARLMATHINARHREVEFRAGDVPKLLGPALRHREEPFTGPAMLELQLAALAAADVKAVLAGQGSDELLGGYPWQRAGAGWYRLRRATPRSAARLARHLAPLSPRVARWQVPMGLLAATDDAAADAEWLRGLTPPQKDRLVASALRGDRPDLTAYRTPESTLNSCRDPLQRRMALDFTQRLTDGILVTNDRMGMAHSLELRLPFLDRAVVDLALGMPSGMKVRDGREKVVLGRIAERLLPAEIAARRKAGLQYPLGSWLRGPLRGFARDRLQDSALARRYLDRPALERWFNASLAYPDGDLKGLWSLVVLTAWWDEFF